MRIRLPTFPAFIVVLGCGIYPTAAAAAAWCLDVERDTVAPLAGASCAGRVVDDAEAEQARQRRIERVRRAVGGGPAVPGAGRGERRLAGVGTGFFITGDGKLLSNNHVIERCSEITVDTAEQRNQPARLVAAAPEVDLALADTAMPPPAFAVFRGNAGGPIHDVATVGFPTQGLAPLQPLLTQGALVGLRQADPQSGIRSPRLEFKADVRGGNSGGPLYDASGLVIGVVFGELDSPKLYRRTGRAVIDVGFAIPTATAAQFLARHGIRPASGTPGAALPLAELHAQAIRQVVRVNCWR